jgi:hypothetical protein
MNYSSLIKPVASAFVIAGVTIVLHGKIDDAGVRSAFAWGAASTTIEAVSLMFRRSTKVSPTPPVKPAGCTRPRSLSRRMRTRN